MPDRTNFRKLTAEYGIGLAEILAETQRYGFTELADIKAFLSAVSHINPTVCEYVYIREKLTLCLITHDNGADYFTPLRRLATRLDYFLRELRACSPAA